MIRNLKNVDENVASILVQEGFVSIEEVAYVPTNELLAIEEFNEGHIQSSINVDFYDSAKFVSFLNKLDKKKSYYVYCRSGKRSYSACEIMKELGFTNLYNLESGYLDWVECNYETVR